jgi:hypothetical protein
MSCHISTQKSVRCELCDIFTVVYTDNEAEDFVGRHKACEALYEAALKFMALGDCSGSEISAVVPRIIQKAKSQHLKGSEVGG